MEMDRKDLWRRIIGLLKYFSCTEFNTASSAAPKIPLIQWILDLNLGPLQSLNWQPDNLTKILDLIYSRLDLIHGGKVCSAPSGL